MAKKIKTIDEVANEIEAYVIDRLNDIDDYIADKYEIECWDSCLDGAVWNKTLNKVVDMYVAAIVSDRDWAGKEFKQTIDISAALKLKAMQKQLKKLEQELKELTA